METSMQQRQQNSEPGQTVADTDGQDSSPSQPHPNKLIVSGFPGGMSARTLRDLFPGARVEALLWRRAVLRFPTPADADAALRARVLVDGVPLAVARPPPRPPHLLPRKTYKEKVAANKRRHYPAEKKLEPELDPRGLDFSGDFHEQLAALLARVRLTQEDVARLGQLFADVETTLRQYWPGCTAHPFGSITAGLGVRGSDADCLVRLPAPDRYAVTRARRLLRQRPDTFHQVFAIPTANTPIVKFVHAPTGTSADVSFKTTLGVRNSRLLAFLMHADARALPAAVAVKYWARVGGLTASGRLTNYALTLMTVFYLQTRLLPPVCSLQSAATAHLVDGWDTGFDERYEALPPVACDASLADLIGGFFEFYAAFDFDADVVNPFLGRAVKKALFDDPQRLPSEYELYKQNVAEGRAGPLRTTTPVCVQDPFEHSHNVASMVTAERAAELQAYIAFAAAAYHAERERGCVGFLKKILLEKPVIRARKKLPEYRMVLKHAYLELVRGAWQDAVRGAALQVFRDLLKLTLAKDESENQPAQQHTGAETATRKERYLATLTKAVWRRKRLVKDFQAVKCFAERQALITQEILASDPAEFSVPIKLELQFTDGKQRRAVVSIRAGEGVPDDVERAQKYWDFGQFFMSVAQGWIYQLLEPHLVPLRERPAPGQTKENTPPRNNGERSEEEEYPLTGSLVIHNSARARQPCEDAAATTESAERFLELADELKTNLKLDTKVDNKKKDNESSSSLSVDIVNSSPAAKST